MNFDNRTGWLGACDAKTRFAYFSLGGPYGEIPILDTQIFDQISSKLISLENNGAVELAYINVSKPELWLVVAYRFTSDRAFNRFYGILIEMSKGILIHGVWSLEKSIEGEKFIR